MKKLCLILIAGFALVMAHDFNGVYAGDQDDGDEIPLSKLAGKYSNVSQGSISFCFNSLLATEPCSAKSTIIPENGSSTGELTQDKDGDFCQTAVGTFGFGGPLAFLPPLVSAFQAVSKVTKYDPATGSGDTSFTNYTGGKCNGSKFDSTGSTVTATGTTHFVVSKGGERTDFVITTINNPQGSVGEFSLNGFNIKQRR